MIWQILAGLVVFGFGVLAGLATKLTPSQQKPIKVEQMAPYKTEYKTAGECVRERLGTQRSGTIEDVWEAVERVLDRLEWLESVNPPNPDS